MPLTVRSAWQRCCATLPQLATILLRGDIVAVQQPNAAADWQPVRITRAAGLPHAHVLEAGTHVLAIGT